ncbi:MAG: hypothetical protein LBQ14_06190, partial [Treponema sp.]|nr:hypothetical protein [Treponema sp.]
DALAGFASASRLDETEMPQIAAVPAETAQDAAHSAAQNNFSSSGFPSPAQADSWFGSSVFDGIVLREPWRRGFRGQPPAAVFAETAAGAAALLEKRGTLVILASPPGLGQRLSGLLEGLPGKGAVSRDLLEAFHGAEEHFFSPSGAEAENYWAWMPEQLESAAAAAGFSVSKEMFDQREERLVLGADIARWFDGEKSSWGAAMAESIGEADLAVLKALLLERAAAGPLTWRWKSFLLKAVRQN